MADALYGTHCTHTAVSPHSLTGTVQRKHTTLARRDARCTTLVRLLRVVVVVVFIFVAAVRQSCLLCCALWLCVSRCGRLARSSLTELSCRDCDCTNVTIYFSAALPAAATRRCLSFALSFTCALVCGCRCGVAADVDFDNLFA